MSSLYYLLPLFILIIITMLLLLPYKKAYDIKGFRILNGNNGNIA